MTPLPSASPAGRPGRCRSSLKVQWPPQKSHSVNSDKLPTLNMGRFPPALESASLKDLSRVAASMNRLLEFDTSKSIKTSPSMMRAKVNCPVTPGVVERRLSELRRFQSPNTKDATGTDCDNVVLNDDDLLPYSPQDQKRHLCDCEFPTPVVQSTREKESPKLITNTHSHNRSSKLQRLWPPILDSPKTQQIIDLRRDKTSREIQRAISGRWSGTIEETRSLYEKTASCNNWKNTEESSPCNTESKTGSLTVTPTRSPVSSSNLEPGNNLSPRIDTLDNEDQLDNTKDSNKYQHAIVESSEEAKPELIINNNGGILNSSKDSVPIFAEIILPSGQRLPPPKGRKKQRRTNYRISYQGPTLLRLVDVYGNLMEIPEVDNRFSTGLGDERPLMKPLRRVGDRRSQDQSTTRSRDVAATDPSPLCPTPRRWRDDVEEDVFVNKLADDHSMSDDEVFGGKRPDIWITPLKSFDGSRKWKVKRVWDVEDVDDKEPEYEVDHSNLMSSIRDLLGVPDDLDQTTQEWQVNIDESNPWDAAGEKDLPPSPARKPTFFVETVYDISGQHAGSDPYLEMSELAFVTKFGDVAECADHDSPIDQDDDEFDDSNQGRPKQRALPAVIWPEERAPPRHYQGTPDKRTWKDNRVLDDDSSKEWHIESSTPTMFRANNKNKQAQRICRESNPSYELPGEWISPLSPSLKPRSTSLTNNGKAVLTSSSRPSASTNERRKSPTTGKEEGNSGDRQKKRNGGKGITALGNTIPTWKKKQTTRTPKEAKEEIKMWWH
jgi:hypothetical protein